MSGGSTIATPGVHGVMYIHSIPHVLCSHAQWAIEAILGPTPMQWSPQPLLPGAMRAEFLWHGPEGTGAHLASAMREWEETRYEVTEDSSHGRDGSRWAHIPSLGLHHGWTNAIGDIVVGEDRIRAALNASQNQPELFAPQMAELLGTTWDEELEPFRYAGDDAPVRWMHRVS